MLGLRDLRMNETVMTIKTNSATDASMYFIIVSVMIGSSVAGGGIVMNLNPLIMRGCGSR